MDKLANGINPIDGTVAPDDDIINNVRLSRCFFFVSDILRQVIENGGIVPAEAPRKLQKMPFFLSYEKRTSFEFSDTPIPASEIARRLNSLVTEENIRKMSYAGITSWLTEIVMLYQVNSPSGGKTKRPTAEGRNTGKGFLE